MYTKAGAGSERWLGRPQTLERQSTEFVVRGVSFPRTSQSRARRSQVTNDGNGTGAVSTASTAGYAHHSMDRNLFVAARQILELSQQELARRLNASLYAVVRWERGDIAPSDDVVIQLKSLVATKQQSKHEENGNTRHSVSFASNGSTAHTIGNPSLFSPKRVQLSYEPSPSVLIELYSEKYWGTSLPELREILNDHPKPARTRQLPIDGVVSAGKNTYTYDAHTYHTKVPPQGIASIIEKYLPDGGVVLDPFAGSGMTGVAARHLGCDAILNELSPAASFIAYNFTRKTDVTEYKDAVHRILDTLQDLRENLYATECRECGLPVEQLYTVWSYQLECNFCGKIFLLWDHCRKYGRTVREHKLLRKFPCPQCQKTVNKSFLKRHDSVPVFLGYRCCKKKIVEHPLLQSDMDMIENAEHYLAEYIEDIPSLDLPNGVNLNQPIRHGLDTISKFYTIRNLTACVAIWWQVRRVKDPFVRAAVAFTFTSLYRRVTRLSEYRFWGGSGNTANLNVPHISNESNVFVTFQRKANSIADHFVTTAHNYRGRCAVHTGSATDLEFLPDNSIDFVFTDPPFGANINYSEMNILWESWLGEFTDSTLEAIVNRVQGKSLQDYQVLMTSSLSEIWRVLRLGHWMLLVFMNSSDKVWSSLRGAIRDAGFSIEAISMFDKQHGTFKQFVSDNTAGSDLIIHCRKEQHSRVSTLPEQNRLQNVSRFIDSQGEQIPTLPFVHVQRQEEVDFRTLYSRYIATAIRDGSALVEFSDFRRLAAARLKGER